MKKNYLYLFVILVFTACGQGAGNESDKQDTTAHTQEIDPKSISGIDKILVMDSINLEANDDMHFNKELFKIKTNRKIVLRLKNTGSLKGTPMSHNVVILQKGTDIATFAEEARNAKKEAEKYSPRR